MSIKAIVLDLAGVLLVWRKSSRVVGEASLIELHQIRHHPVRHDFEAGRIGEESLYSQLSSETNFSRDVLERVLNNAFQTSRVNEPVYDFAKAQKYGSGRRVICLSNTPHCYIGRLFKKLDIWNVFDRIYMSSLLGMAKPDQRVFRHLLNQENLRPEEVFSGR